MTDRFFRQIQTTLIALSVFCLWHFCEVFFHSYVLFYHELWAMQVTIALLFFVLFGALPVFAVSVLGDFAFRNWSWSKSHPYLASLIFAFSYLFGLQVYLLQKNYYEPQYLYWIILAGYFLLLIVLLNSFRLMRQIFQLLFVLLFVGVSAFQWFSFGGVSSDVSARPRPNILVLMIDTLRRDHLDFYGYSRDTAPFLSTLAEQGVIFDDVLSTSSWTKPSMASVFTSRYLVTNEIHRQEFPLRTGQKRLAEFFAEQGYDTAFFSANPNAGTYYRGSLGFRYVMQPDPASHFPLSDFVLPRFLKYFGNLPKAVQFENAKRRLLDFQDALGFKTIADVELFANGEMTSAVIPESEFDLYRRQIKPQIAQYANLHKTMMLPEDKWRNELRPLFQWIYQKSLEYVFISLKGSRGEVVMDHWMEDYEIVTAFRKWFVHTRNRKQPFLAHLQFMSPHSPYYEQPPVMLPPFGANSNFDVEMPPAKHILPSQGAPELPKDELQSLIDNYDSAIRVTDENIRSLVEYLKTEGEWDNTIVVIASDHGEALYDHRMYDHMYSMYSELVNVPLVFLYPKKLVPQRSALPASLIDLYPSLMTLAGYGAGDVDFEGVSLFKSPSDLSSNKSFVGRKRYGAVVLGTKPKMMSLIKNLYDPTNKSGHQQTEAYHRYWTDDEFKFVQEIEAANLEDRSKDDVERIFRFKSGDVVEDLKSSQIDASVAEEELRILPAVPLNLFE